MNFINKFKEEKSIENKISKIRETIIWINNKENKFLNQLLKNQLVESSVNEINAKGERRTKTCYIE